VVGTDACTDGLSARRTRDAYQTGKREREGGGGGREGERERGREREQRKGEMQQQGTNSIRNELQQLATIARGRPLLLCGVIGAVTEFKVRMQPALWASRVWDSFSPWSAKFCSKPSHAGSVRECSHLVAKGAWLIERKENRAGRVLPHIVST
jgi:hypothetical protein